MTHFSPENAAASTAKWLQTIIGSRMETEHLTQAIALASVCAALNPKACDLLIQPAFWQAQNLRNFDFSASNIVNSLMAATFLQKIKGDLVTGASNYITLLNEVVPQSPTNANEAYVRTTLQNNTSDQIETEMVLDIDLRHLRSGNNTKLKNVLDIIETHTRFGTLVISEQGPIGALLEGSAMQALSKYDLPLAFRALRACAYLGRAGSFVCDSGLDFIGLCQNANGVFGDFDTSVAKMRRDTSEGQPELSLYLSISLQALWTMAELSEVSGRPFRLTSNMT